MSKKLIEVALPLEAINKESAREKSIRHGHPSTLHLWWARRPLAACRAVLFACLVDDPGEYLPDEESAKAERQRLFALIEELVIWENSNDQEILDKARLEIARSVARNLGVEMPVGKAAIRQFLAEKAPPVLDPFAGGGSIPLEAQRLGLRAYASDLNPVAVLICKALIEVPPKFADQPPIHPPEEENGQAALLDREWRGARGLAEDVRYYGKWMRDQAEKRIGHLYPKVKLPPEHGGGEATVIAWLWTRTVMCPNPACGARMRLVRSFWLSKKKNRQAWVVPIVDRSTQPPQIRFSVKTGRGTPPDPPKIGRGAKFRCLACDQVAAQDHVRREFQAKRDGTQMMTIVADTSEGRTYLPPHPEHIAVANSAAPAWMPEAEMNTETPNLVSGRGYGITHWHELFTRRQLAALTTFSDLVGEARARVHRDAGAAGLPDDGIPLNDGGTGATAYADAVATYLALGIDRIANTLCTIARWTATRDQTVTAFARQALPMTWDYPDVNPFAGAAGDLGVSLASIAEAMDRLPSWPAGRTEQLDAIDLSALAQQPLISTDPPYYDNIGYADLSDFFYIWLRRSLRAIYPDLFSTVLVPKAHELVATPYRFDGDREKARQFFEGGLGRVLERMRANAHVAFPVTIYYAFKQAETDAGSAVSGSAGVSPAQGGQDDRAPGARASTGWETMLEGLMQADFQITGTWPMRTELRNRPVASGTNALASSIVLVCRPRPEDAPLATRRDFLAALKQEVPVALRTLQEGNIAPVDLAQAAIGPGMAIFSRYRQVLEADGSPMRVRAALALINQTLDEFLAEQEGDFDGDTRWAVAWFEQYGHREGPYGVAETLSKAKNTSPEGMMQAGILESRGGKVRLLRRGELDPEWDPSQDHRLTAWEATQHLVRALDEGEQVAAGLLARLGAAGDAAHDLAYRLYTICDRKGWAQEALGYNMLVVAWPRLKDLAARQVARQERMI